jgi:hypothetical protein
LAFILILLAWLYHTSVILFWIIVAAFVGICIYAVCSTK